MLKRFFIVAIVAISLGVAGFNEVAAVKNDGRNAPDGLENTYDPIVVLELFTSQGCSSCPAADRLLDEVKKQHPEQVFTLSYHVDYWNYIGWKDPFSNSEYAHKQRVYNQKLGYRGNYTPEVVVNGKSHFTGSNRTKMNSAIVNYGKERVPNKITVSKSGRTDGKVVFQYEAEGDVSGKKVRALLVLDERTTEVKRGENRNRTIKNSNIVVVEKTMPLSDTSETGEITVPDVVETADKLHLILLVENSDHDITAAAKQTL